MKTSYIIDSDTIHSICPMFDDVMTIIESKTNGQRLLRRSDFTPRDFVNYLPNIAFYELKFDDHNKISDLYCILSGGRIAAFFGEATGKYLRSVAPEDVNIRALERCQFAVDKRREVAVDSQSLALSREYMTISALYVPLENENGDIDKVMVFINEVKDS